MFGQAASLQRPFNGGIDAPRMGEVPKPQAHPSILLFTRDTGFAGTIERLLVRNGYSVIVAESMTGLHLHDGNQPSLALIDRRLDIIEHLRNQVTLQTIPCIAILPVEHQFSEEDCIDDLEKGYDLVFCSDRYRELIAQIRAMFRRKRSDHPSNSVLRAGPLVMDLARYEITVANVVKPVTNKEFEILRQLLLTPGHVLSRQDLLNRVWGEDYALEEHALDVHIHSLRRKIEPDPSKPRFIMTVRGVGYKLLIA
jgi:two-component system, OmpR family, response regulator RegX3